MFRGRAPDPSMAQKLLYISNGHGEDNHSSHIIRTLRAIRPELDIAALPIVGEGNAYKKIGIPIVGPTYTLPSGGFTYMNRLRLIDDIKAGLLTMTWKQYKAMKAYVPQVDFVAATGDTIGQAFALLSGKPFVSFIAAFGNVRRQAEYGSDFVADSKIAAVPGSGHSRCVYR